MQTTIEILSNDTSMLRIASNVVTVLGTGIFGVDHWIVGKYEFKANRVKKWSAGYSQRYWTMTVGGKTSVIPYKYVIALTLKESKLI